MRRVLLLLAGWGLSVSGDFLLGEWRDLVLGALRVRYGGNERTASKVAAEASRLFRYLAARGADSWADVTEQLVTEWCWAPRPDRWGRMHRPAQSTARNRQWAALAVFEEAKGLGAPVEPVSLVGERIKRRDERIPTRPLTDEEARLVEEYADSGLVASRRSLIVACSFAGGTATEIATLRMGDVDLGAATIRFGGPTARTNSLEGWAKEAFARFVRNNPPVCDQGLLCVSGRTDDASAAHSVTARLWEVLRDAGIAGREGVSARSIRLATARRILEESGIEAAARFLGSPSLDTTADALGHAWQLHRPGEQQGR